MNKSVLICDDDLHILRAAEFKLRRGGMTVLCASDGEQAWETILQHRPDILVTDCQMPRLDGIGLVERIRATPETQRLPVVMLTAKGFELEHEDLRERLRIVAVLNKPFSPRELRACVEQILEKSGCEPAAGPVFRGGWNESR